MEYLRISPVAEGNRWQGCFMFDIPTPQERVGAKQFDPLLPFVGNLKNQFFINLESVQIWCGRIVLRNARRSNRSSRPRLVNASDSLFFEPPSFIALVRNSLSIPKGNPKEPKGWEEKTLWYLFSDIYGNLIFQQRPPGYLCRKWKRPQLSERSNYYHIKT
jgi:hypothetical protein